MLARDGAVHALVHAHEDAFTQRLLEGGHESAQPANLGEPRGRERVGREVERKARAARALSLEESCAEQRGLGVAHQVACETERGERRTRAAQRGREQRDALAHVARIAIAPAQLRGREAQGREHTSRRDQQRFEGADCACVICGGALGQWVVRQVERCQRGRLDDRESIDERCGCARAQTIRREGKSL